MPGKTSDYGVSDASDSEYSARQIPHEGIRRFRERLKYLMKDKSVRGFAAECGLSEGVLRSYLRGETFPTLDRLAAIAAAGGVDAAWLATGDRPSAPDRERLQSALEVVEKALKIPASPTHKARIVAAAYEMLEESDPAAEAADRMVRLIKSTLGQGE